MDSAGAFSITDSALDATMEDISRGAAPPAVRTSTTASSHLSSPSFVVPVYPTTDWPAPRPSLAIAAPGYFQRRRVRRSELGSAVHLATS